MNNLTCKNVRQIASIIIFIFGLFVLNIWITHPASAEESDTQVIGGGEAEPGEWPWMVALVLAPVEDAYDGHFCGGTLIAPEWVLTAAHCVEDLQIPYIDVVLGRHDLHSDEGERIGIEEKIIHPNYNPSILDSDLALLKLERPSSQQFIQISPKLQNNPQTFPPEIKSVVTGWGNTSPDEMDYPERLQEVELPIVAREVCNAPEAYAGDVTENMLCAGYAQGGEDSCKGDSGGPLMSFDVIQSQWTQVGIVSWGEGCAEPNHYGVYTNLELFSEWVNQEIASPIVNEHTVWLPIVISQ